MKLSTYTTALLLSAMNSWSSAIATTLKYAGLKCDAGSNPVIATMALYSTTSNEDGTAATITHLELDDFSITIFPGWTQTMNFRELSLVLESDVTYLAVVDMMAYDSTTLEVISSDKDTFQFTLEDISSSGELRFSACEDSTSPKTAACYAGVAEDSDSIVVTKMGAPSRDPENGGACCVPGARGGCTTPSPTVLGTQSPTTAPSQSPSIATTTSTPTESPTATTSSPTDSSTTTGPTQTPTIAPTQSPTLTVASQSPTTASTTSTPTEVSTTLGYVGFKCDAGSHPVTTTMTLYSTTSNEDGTKTTIGNSDLEDVSATISAGGTRTVNFRHLSLVLESDVTYTAVVNMTAFDISTLEVISSDEDKFEFTLEDIDRVGELRFNACEDSSSPRTAACYAGVSDDSDSTVVTRMGAPSRHPENSGACCVPGARGGCSTLSPTFAPTNSPTNRPLLRRRN